MWRVTFLVCCLHLVSYFAAGQEICNNGIDDDFDGFIDCFDGNCASNPDCQGFFLGNDAACQSVPPAFPDFTITLDFSSPDETTNHLSRMAVGDLDRDGIPEIITMNRYTKKLFVLNGSDGSIKAQTTVTWEPYWEIAIGNLNDDNCAEIFFIGYFDPPGPNNAGVFIYSYDCNLNFLWNTASRLPGDPVNFGLADFDGDGKVELYAKDEIYDAHTGVRIVKTTASNYDEINGGPVAADILGDSRLELISGLSIYQVNLGARTLDAGSLTLLDSRPEYFIRYRYNATSVADYNQDGFIDVVASGSTVSHGQNTTIFFWDVQNDALLTYIDPGGDYAPNGWKNGTGRVNISDLDGDGQLNLSYVSGKYLYALKEDMTLLWRVVVNEETSGYTGCTLFDFNGDGKSEIVYRDEQFLYIIDGTDGSIFTQQSCISRTNREYPIVADVDADGSTELCVTCGFDDAASWTNFNTLSYSRYSHVRVFKSASDPWVPARRLWNQHGYFVVNVNDDLTIPKVIQKHHLVWSAGSCTQGANRPLNKFLNQSPFLNTDGCPVYAAPDFAFSGGAPVVNPPTCPDLDFTVSFTITNQGDVVLNGDIPVTFYSANPFLPGAVKLNTDTVTVVNLGVGDTFTVTNMLVKGIGSDSLYVSLNDNGSSVPTPIVLPNTNIFECSYPNNVVGVPVNPLPVPLTAVEVQPNDVCAGVPTGVARAFVPMGGGVENTTDYNFYWSVGPVAKPIASIDFTGPVYGGIPDGTYTVYAIHKTANCSSDTTQVVVTPTSTTPSVTINIVSHQTVCNPPNGMLEAVVAGGNAGYSFDWFDIALNPLGIAGPMASGLQASSYIVQATKGGCTALSPSVTVNGPVNPDAQAQVLQHITSCTTLSNGSVTADALVGAVVQPPGNYTFDWYQYDNITSTRGSILPPVHGTGPTRTDLPAGFYQVEIKDNATQCVAVQSPVVEVQAQTILPVAVITELAPQTSCNPAAPNGVLAGDAQIGGVIQNPSLYTFEWFLGQNTLPANAHAAVSGVNGRIASQIKGGGQAYTVKVTDPLTGCSGIEDATVSENINVPVVTLAAADNAICNPSLASSNFTGSLTASVTFGGVPVVSFTDYSFTWFNGTQAVGLPRPEVTQSLTQLDSGFYTLVVTRTDLGCVSAPETERVNNSTSFPAVTASADASTNCVPSLANGGVQVTDVDGLGTPATHNYEWHRGVTVAGYLVSNNAVSPDTLQGATGRFYTVLVTNTLNGCQDTETVEVSDGSEKPIVTLGVVDNTICDPVLAGTTENGSVIVTGISYKGAPFAGALSYQWFDGIGTGTPNGSSVTATLPNLGAGFYSSTVSITALGCTSDVVSAEVIDNFTPPVLLTTPGPSTNCAGGNPNGSMSAAVDVGGVPTTAGFTFQWFTGIDPLADPLVPAVPNLGNTSDAILLQGGQNFTVRVTNQSTGCQSAKTAFLPDDSETPILSLLTFSPNVNCIAPFNGTAMVDGLVPFTYRGSVITAPYTGFTLTWSGGTVNPAGDQISGLAAGTYTLQVTAGSGNTVTNNNDNCVSLAAQAVIVDDLVFPAVSVAKVNQTSCDVVSPNGQLTATETSGSGSYTFDWFPGLGAGAAGTGLTEVVDGQTTAVLASGDYTVLVQNTATRCETTQSTFLPDNIVPPSIGFIGITSVTACAAPNGSATPLLSGISAPPNTDYTIYYVRTYSDAVNPQTAPSDPLVIKASPDTYSSTSPVLNNGVEPPTVTGLAPGYLTALVVDNYTACESGVTTIPIGDATAANTITVGAVVASGFCGGTGGSIDITPAGGAGGYTFEWYSGTPSNVDINFFNNPPDMSSGVFITNAQDLGIVTPVGGVGSGTYTVIVRDAVGCGAYTIGNVPFAGSPAIVLTPTDPTRCIAPFDGSLNVSVTGVQTYSIIFHDGNGPAFPVLLGEVCDDGLDNDGNGFTDGADPTCGIVGNQSLTLPAIDAGEYFVEVIDYTVVNRPCPLGNGIVLNQQGFAPNVLVGTIGANTSCTPATLADGSVEVVVTRHASDTRDPVLTPIVFEVTSVSPAPVSPPAFPAVLSSGSASVTSTLSYGFGPQSYDIRITEATSGCFTDQNVVIPDLPVVPNILPASLVITNDSFCAPLSNGSARITAVNPVALSDYEFTWYSDVTLSTQLYQANGTGAGGGELFNASKPGYVLGAPGQGIGLQTYYVRAERLSGAGAGCLTPALQAVIQDEHVTPQITLASSPDTSCDVLIGEGSISVETVTISPVPAVQSALYTYSIVPDPNAVSPLAGQNGALSTPFIRLPFNGGAPYTVTAVNQVSGCQQAAGTTLTNQKYSLSVTASAITDKLVCNPDGEIDVTQVTIDRALTGQGSLVFNSPLAADWEFRWFKNVPGTFASGSPLQDGASVTLTGESLVVGSGAGEYPDPAPDNGAGTYYVVARRLTGPGLFGANCETPPLQLVIADLSEDPIASLTPAPNTSCDPATFEGAISVSVSDSSAVAGPFNYNYTWSALTAGRTAPPVVNPYAGGGDLFSQIQDGVYQLSVLNNITGCTSVATQATVQQASVPIIIPTASTLAKAICFPDGRITVDSVMVGGVREPVHADFRFHWYLSDPGTPELVPPANGNDVLDVVDLPATMGAGLYYVKVSRTVGGPSNGCESAPLAVNVLDVSEDPDVSLVQSPNSSCNPALPNATITATAVERDATTDVYTFTWTLNTAPLPGFTVQTDASPVSQLTVAPEGTYAVTVNNVLTGCAFSRGITVDLNQTLSLPNIVSVTPTSPTDCLPTGSARVSQITIGGTTTFSDPPDDVNTTFDYEWYQGSVPGGLLAGEQNSQLLNRLPGHYFVLVQDLTTSCKSTPVEVVIDTASIVYPDLRIQQTALQINCSVPPGTAQLVATADGQDDTNPNYTFEWYRSLDLSGPLFATTSTVSSLADDNYSLSVLNTITNCRSSAYYIVPDNSNDFLPRLSLAGNPVTECDSIDGSVFIRGIQFPLSTDPSKNYPFAYSYTADLYIGSPPANPAVPEFPNVPNDPAHPTFTENFLQPGLVNGLYTVRLTDNNTGCVTLDTVSVKDKRHIPVLTLQELQPVTNCDPGRPNGVAIARADGDIVNHQFYWYESATATGVPVYDAPQYGDLKATPVVYTVTATHLITGCADTAQIQIRAATLPIPAPAIEILSHVTSCLTGNGALTASVGGNTSDYVFDWYDGSVETPPADFVGETYRDLIAGIYSVTATDRITGCKSPLVSETVLDRQVYPEFDFIIRPATCGLTNGYASLVIQNEVSVADVEWRDAGGGVLVLGPNLIDVLPGTYTVIVTTELGCVTSEDISIGTEIRPYNGVSRNGDGRNDIFQIDCIENFPDNIVKIFNRAGTLVYEEHGYDNITLYFDGRSNKGFSPMGTNLPDGTYFFVINKMDGSEPISGYLEIVN